ncbi:MAG: hypothetical protein RLZZ46_309, partial [Bacteroidota bacterium]
YTAHAGAVLPISEFDDLSISPNILYQHQGNFQQLNLGLYVNKSAIVGGVWYRHQDAVIVLIGFKQERYRIGYSYDVTVSRLSTASSGSHEVSLILNLKCKVKKKRFNTIDCPTF